MEKYDSVESVPVIGRLMGSRTPFRIQDASRDGSFPQIRSSALSGEMIPEQRQSLCPDSVH